VQFQGGLLQAPLNPLKTDVSWGPPGLSGGPGPLGPHRNSTTGYVRYICTHCDKKPYHFYLCIITGLCWSILVFIFLHYYNQKWPMHISGIQLKSTSSSLTALAH